MTEDNAQAEQDNDGYPQQHELDLIRQWDYNNIFGLFDYIHDRWNWAPTAFKKYWDKKDGRLICFIELHTGGWSGNESIINAFLENNMVVMLSYVQWRVGGHYWFEIDPTRIGYKLVNDLRKELCITRQAIYGYPDMYDWIIASDNKRFVKRKK